MYRSGGRLFMVLALTLAGIDCFRWTADLPDNSIEYAYTSDDLRLPWDYTTSPGDGITAIQWFFQDRSQESIAIYSRGNFAPMAAFANRVQYVPNAGLILNHVVAGDSGNYSVEISGHDASGSFFMYRRTVVVQVRDKVSRRIGFTARLSSAHSASGTLVYSYILSSYGAGYSSSTGIFTAPIAGLYFFTAMSRPLTGDEFPDSTVMKEGSVLCYMNAPAGAPGDSSSCGAVVHLSVGQRVWVESRRHLSHLSTFAGFLINSD